MKIISENPSVVNTVRAADGAGGRRESGAFRDPVVAARCVCVGVRQPRDLVMGWQPWDEEAWQVPSSVLVSKCLGNSLESLKQGNDMMGFTF